MVKTARSRFVSPASSSTAAIPDSPTDTADDLASLALQACDDIYGLREVLSAYVCLERLVAPAEVGDTEELWPTRSELGAMLRVMNEVLGRRIEMVERGVGRVRGAVGAGGRVT